MATRTLDWLPERHLGVAATLAHADELIGQITDLLFEYQVESAEVIGLEEVRAGSVSRTVVTHVAPIPQKIPLLAADALVALRSAIEHTLFAEVESRNDGPLGETAAKLVDMPAKETYDEFSKWLRSKARRGPNALKAGSELIKRIDGLQPFHRTKDSHLHPLARLTQHTNHAKHRTPAVTAIRVAAIIREDSYPRSFRDLPTRPEEPLEVGQVLAETPLGMRVPVSLFPTVGISRPGTDRWPVLMQELDEIASWVRMQAIPRLITGGEPPTPSLPARYAISVGHPDTRSAIAAGTPTSAAERHKQRLGAASVRADFARDIAGLDDAPSEEDVAAWLAQLSDVEVLDRMSRMQVSQPLSETAVLHTWDFYHHMRDEAAAYVERRDLVPTQSRQVPTD